MLVCSGLYFLSAGFQRIEMRSLLLLCLFGLATVGGCGDTGLGSLNTTDDVFCFSVTASSTAEDGF